MVPNLKHIVQGVRDSRSWDFSTKDGLCTYTHACILALYRHDPRFLHLRKRKPQNGCYAEGATEGHAVDAALYVPTGQAVDFIGNAGVGNDNPVIWSIKDPIGKYDPEDGLEPTDDLSDPSDLPMPPDDDGPDTIALEMKVADLEAKVAALKLISTEIHKQIGSINDWIKAHAETAAPTVEQHVHDVGRGWLTLTTGPPR